MLRGEKDESSTDRICLGIKAMVIEAVYVELEVALEKSNLGMNEGLKRQSLLKP